MGDADVHWGRYEARRLPEAKGAGRHRLAHRCRDLDTGEISSASVIEFDRNYFASWPPQVDVDYLVEGRVKTSLGDDHELVWRLARAW